MLAKNSVPSFFHLWRRFDFVILTNNFEHSTDWNEWLSVDLANVLSGVRLLDLPQVEVIRPPGVVGDADAVVLRDHRRVHRQRALLGVEPRNLKKRCASLQNFTWIFNDQFIGYSFHFLKIFLRTHLCTHIATKTSPSWKISTKAFVAMKVRWRHFHCYV